MLKTKFKNGKEIEYLQAIETEEYFNGSSRRTLTVECSPTAVSIDELNTTLSSEENLVEIVMANLDDKGVVTTENIYSGYVLKLELGIKQQLANQETNTYSDKLVFKIGKRTYIEEKLHDLGL